MPAADLKFSEMIVMFVGIGSWMNEKYSIVCLCIFFSSPNSYQSMPLELVVFILMYLL